MSVIINDFEVVVEPPPERPGPAAAETPAAPAPETLRPDDVRRVMRRRSQRLARVWAH